MNFMKYDGIKQSVKDHTHKIGVGRCCAVKADLKSISRRLLDMYHFREVLQVCSSLNSINSSQF